MSEWPLHITIADVYAIDRKQQVIDDKLQKLLQSMHPVKTYATGDTTLGTTEVTLVEKSEPLQKLHMKIVDLLIENGAEFNAPEFTGEGFLPHVTIQSSDRLHRNNAVVIDTLSLIDMYPDADWKQRRVLKTFSLGS